MYYLLNNKKNFIFFCFASSYHYSFGFVCCFRISGIVLLLSDEASVPVAATVIITSAIIRSSHVKRCRIEEEGSRALGRLTPRPARTSRTTRSARTARTQVASGTSGTSTARSFAWTAQTWRGREASSADLSQCGRQESKCRQRFRLKFQIADCILETDSKPYIHTIGI